MRDGRQSAHFVRTAETGLFTASLAAMQAGRFAFSLALASRLEPASFTVWALLVAALGYSPLVMMGLINGLGRSLPYLVGAGQQADARRSEGTVWALALGLFLACTVPAAALSVWGRTTLALLILSMFGSWLLLQLQQVILRSHLKFGPASRQQLGFGILSLSAGVGFVLIPPHSLEEALALHTLVALGALSIGAAAHPPTVSRPRLRTAVQLAAMGLPIGAAGALFSLLLTADRWVAAALLGGRDAAPYALAATIASGLMVVPNALSQQTYPRMARAYGATRQLNEVLRLAAVQNRTAGRATLLVTGPVSILAAVTIPFLPSSYREAVPILIVLTISPLALAHSTGYGNALNTLGGQWLYLLSQAGALINGVAAMNILGMVLGLPGIALGAGVGHFTFAILARWAVRFVTRHLDTGRDPGGAAEPSEPPTPKPQELA